MTFKEDIAIFERTDLKESVDNFELDDPLYLSDEELAEIEKELLILETRRPNRRN